MTTHTTPPAPTRAYGTGLDAALPATRVTEEVRTRAEQRAERDGMSLSELMRTAIVSLLAEPASVPETLPPRVTLFGKDPIDVLRETWGAGARGGMDFDTWLAGYVRRAEGNGINHPEM